MIRQRLADQRAGRAEAGISLVELMVTMMLLGMILLMASSMYISVAQTTTHSQSVNEGTRIASNAMTAVNRVVRFGVENPQANVLPNPAFSFAGKTKMTIFSLVDADASDDVTERPMEPRMVTFELDGVGNLNEYRWAAQAAGNYWKFPAATLATATSSRVLGGKFLAIGTPTPLFRYFSDDWNSGTNDYVELTPVGNNSLSAADRARVKFVEVTMNTVPLDRPDDVPVIITNRIGLLNLATPEGGD